MAKGKRHTDQHVGLEPMDESSAPKELKSNHVGMARFLRIKNAEKTIRRLGHRDDEANRHHRMLGLFEMFVGGCVCGVGYWHYDACGTLFSRHCSPVFDFLQWLLIHSGLWAILGGH